MSNPYSAYLESKVLSASPLQLVVLAYEGAIEAVRSARVHLANKQVFDRSRAITKAQCLISELQSSLDPARGGDLALELARLYRYMQSRLQEANFKQIEAPLAEVEHLLETLASSWREIAAAENFATAAMAASPWNGEAETNLYTRAALTL